jgi:hypothetical protein
MAMTNEIEPCGDIECKCCQWHRRDKARAAIRMHQEYFDLVTKVLALYPVIEHGEPEHRAWLAAKLKEHFSPIDLGGIG